MKERPVVVFFAGFLIAAVLGLGGVYVWRQTHSGPRPTGDDDPIVVAGGSFEIGSLRGFDPALGIDHRRANHIDTTRVLNRVEVLYNKPASAGDDGGPAYAEIIPDSQHPVKIAFAYCPNKCANATPDDTITFTADSDHKNLAVSNGDQNHPIGNIPAKSKRFRHGQNWQVNGISVTVGTSPKTDYLCDNGKCQVVLHYNCAGGPNACP